LKRSEESSSDKWSHKKTSAMPYGANHLQIAFLPRIRVTSCPKPGRKSF